MPTDLIRYDLLVQDALKGVVRRVLANAIRDGIPGEHHFYLSFRTREKGVRISQALRDKYPDEMTIVLQHQFWDLSVSDYAIEVGLSFSNVPEKLVIPFDAVSGFFDPSVQFGLKFEQSKGDAPAGAARALPSIAKDEAQGKLPLRGAPSEAGKPARKGAEKAGRPSAEAKATDAKIPTSSLPMPSLPMQRRFRCQVPMPSLPIRRIFRCQAFRCRQAFGFRQILGGKLKIAVDPAMNGRRMSRR